MQKFRTALTSSKQRPFLYHFTDIRNLPSIDEHGLLSLRALRRQGIVPPAPGGNDWSHEADERIDLDRYVHLCLCDQHPMEFAARNDKRIVESLFLHVLPGVLDTPGVLFCDEVSNKAGAITRPIETIDDHVDLEVVFGYTDWNDPAIRARLNAARKFEILVPDRIAIDLLRR